MSAWLNSFATFWDIPTFLANWGLWAAAAIVRACFFVLLGMGCLRGLCRLGRRLLG